MLKFEKDGKIVMTESDNGELKITEEAPKEWTTPKTTKPGGPTANEQTGEQGPVSD